MSPDQDKPSLVDKLSRPCSAGALVPRVRIAVRLNFDDLLGDGVDVERRFLVKRIEARMRAELREAPALPFKC